MKEMNVMAKKELLEAYQLYLSLGNNKISEEKAKYVYDRYIHASVLVSDKLMSFVARLFAIAYPHFDHGVKPPSKEETKAILRELKTMHHLK